MKNQFIARIPKLNVSMAIQKEEFCTFITHFGLLGDIEIYDKRENEIILNTAGTCINRFYPNIENRKLAYFKAEKYHPYFHDYKYQKERKYPRGRLKEIYLSLLKITQ